MQSRSADSEESRQQFFLYKVMPELADETWSTRSGMRRRRRSSSKARNGIARVFLRRGAGHVRRAAAAAQSAHPADPRRPKWTGYEVVLDVWPEVFAWGILLVPKDLKPGERRPVVVCQHGRNGLPKDVDRRRHCRPTTTSPRGLPIAASSSSRRTTSTAAKTATAGSAARRTRSRRRCSPSSSRQHEQILDWLATLPFVDAKRIAFYGLSYGGETAMRVPPLLEQYCLSICSGDFNSGRARSPPPTSAFSFMFTIEWEMPYFNLGNTFDYAEMAYLMVPRPFMVERGHDDRVGRDEWVAYEYAKVRWLYAQLGWPTGPKSSFSTAGTPSTARARSASCTST